MNQVEIPYSAYTPVAGAAPVPQKFKRCQWCTYCRHRASNRMSAVQFVEQYEFKNATKVDLNGVEIIVRADELFVSVAAAEAFLLEKELDGIRTAKLAVIQAWETGERSLDKLADLAGLEGRKRSGLVGMLRMLQGKNLISAGQWVAAS